MALRRQCDGAVMALARHAGTRDAAPALGQQRHATAARSYRTDSTRRAPVCAGRRPATPLWSPIKPDDWRRWPHAVRLPHTASPATPRRRPQLDCPAGLTLHARRRPRLCRPSPRLRCVDHRAAAVQRGTCSRGASRPAASRAGRSRLWAARSASQGRTATFTKRASIAARRKCFIAASSGGLGQPGGLPTRQLPRSSLGHQAVLLHQRQHLRAGRRLRLQRLEAAQRRLHRDLLERGGVCGRDWRAATRRAHCTARAARGSRRRTPSSGLADASRLRMRSAQSWRASAILAQHGAIPP